MNHQSAAITRILKINLYESLYKNLSEVTIGDRIKKLRLLKGYSQNYLGKLLDLSHSTIDDYESTRCYPSTNILNKIAKTLEKPIEYFYDDYYKFIFSNFGKRIKEWRTNNSLTLWEAGKITGIDFRSIQNWENGTIMDRTYFQILIKFLS
ncbi:Transcriptional regulator, contains XRE-family HTH domain [Clostridium acidisoli DSM 12555]|uniref:Transcriptional regulator, contains XRE-family HTH domain n=1 Tax=Clostridium acidisoli DSM 12555 TaxID=1121291 RepID=A0A1W1WZW8_9CLOT|nr:helix-turn-helix transcriptional regulator [Clostridium acidisoli]SMC17080.1 Transcriptional regulator, contains XRE-family HTH domain [Clostridium acidisoli DSM 12555]